MNTIGLKQFDFLLGTEKVWYRDIEAIETEIADIGLPDAEDLWGWGHFRRFEGGFSRQVHEGFGQLLMHQQAINSIIICAPCKADTQVLVNAVKLELQPALQVDDGHVHLIEGHDCVGVIKALDEASALIAAGNENVLIVVAERVASEDKRFRKFALFSDICFSMVVSADVDSCEYELIDIHVEQDDSPPESSSGILSRKLDTYAVQSLFEKADLEMEDIDKFFYINLYQPIAEMKIIDLGFKRALHYFDTIKQVAHCYGVDPFWNMVTFAQDDDSEGLYVLGASAKTGVGMVALQKL